MAIVNKEFFKVIGEKEEDRIRFRFLIEKGKVTNLVIQYEAIINGKWKELVRYDFAHGFFHRDLMFSNGEKEKKRIEIQNLKNASVYAEEDIKDRWQWYKENFKSKLKKK